MNFGDPAYLPALWLLIPLAVTLAWLYRTRRRRLAAMLEASAIGRVAADWRPRRRILRLVLWIGAMALLLFSLARPQWGFKWQQASRRGLDILILLDTSRSMLASDFKPTRMQQAKWGLRDFVAQLRGDRVGLIPFAGTAFLHCPLTIDYAAFRMSLEEANVGIVPRGGTSISSALRVAVETFDKQAESDRVLLLVTDGEDHEGDPARWIPELKEKGIRVYAVGVGSREGEPLPAADGSPGFQKDAAGNVILSTLREDPLKALALETGGAYVRAAPGDIGLDELLRTQWDALKRAETDSRLAKLWEERAGWFIGGSLVLLALESALRERNGSRRAAS
jgi:Ca-activated chloride channel family protein